MTQKKALLIASSYNGLSGPSNDVRNMALLLGELGFISTQCCEHQATRDGIRAAWNRFIESLSLHDTVVVYYSGHGGMVESTSPVSRDTPWRHQFLVPFDFVSNAHHFNGITDREISYWLKRMTDKADNVTIILDCCFAGRMARDPSHGDNAKPRGLSMVRFEDIAAHVSILETVRELRLDAFPEENPSAVRIAAASPTESAWEYCNSNGEWCGVLTESLILVLRDIVGSNRTIPWRSAMIRVSELVQAEFPQQHPRVEGRGNRHPFSRRETITGEFPADKDATDLLIQGGRVSGIHQGSLYKLMHSGNQIAEARVMTSDAFQARASLEPWDQTQFQLLPNSHLTVVLRENTFHKLPIVVHPSTPELENVMRTSRFIQPATRRTPGPLATLSRQGQSITVSNHFGIRIFEVSWPANPTQVADLIRRLEQLGRAHHLLGLRPEPYEQLRHGVTVEVNWFGNTNRPPFRKDGTDYLTVRDRITIGLRNSGSEQVYAWVFAINGLGRVSLPRASSIDLPAGREEVIGNRGRGLPITWPTDCPYNGALPEAIIVVLTNSRFVDLGHLKDPVGTKHHRRGGLSKLEQWTWKIAENRTIGDETGDDVCFESIYIPYLLRR
ncbi:hypothetical protein TruAng_001914 [Truncatella angustata]|nr:hypothetical protein TruAng_001914 [Truncatella angustata]